MKTKLTSIEWLVIVAIVTILIGAIFNAAKGVNSVTFGPDLKPIYTIELAGHEYYKSGEMLTHSASCKACKGEK